jgi:glutamate 5-kinase
MARKRWIATMKPRGTMTVDAGAAHALKNGKSLLPAGVTDLSGDFGRGDPVGICTDDGTQIGVGLTRYTLAEAALIKGCQSDDIEHLLGYKGRAAVIHRDDMVL